MSSKRRLRRKACGRKVRHTSKGNALIALSRMSPGKQDVMSAYKCQFCGGWHIGRVKAAVRTFNWLYGF